MPREAPDGPLAEGPPSRLWRFGWVLPVALTLGLYLFTLRFPFEFDDFGDIVRSNAVHALWPPRWLGVSRRTLVLLTWALNWAWTGSQPWSYRLVNIAIHAANAALLWRCVSRALRGAEEDDARDRTADALATAVATLWAVHPLHTSAVTYVVHRYESLAGLFLLATLACWQRAREAPARVRWVALAALSAVLAVLSKEIGVLGPVLLMAYDHAFADSARMPRAQRRKGLALVALAAWGVAAVTYPRVASAPSQGVHAGLGRLEYFRSEMGVLVHYLRLIVAPTRLSVDYCDWPIARTWQRADVACLVVVAALVLASLWAFAKRAPRLGWLGLVFFGVLAPTSTVIPLVNELAAERRLYVPLAAALSLLVLGLHRVARGRMVLVAAFTVLAAAGLSAATVARNRTFQTCTGLYAHDLATRPRCGRIHHNLAVCIEQQGRDRDAWAHYARALQLTPGCCATHQEMGMIALRLGWDELTMHHLSAQIAETPERRMLWLVAINLQLAVGDDARALRVADRAAARFPRSPEVAERRAWVLATARDARVVDGERALREAQRALSLTPALPPISRVVTLAAALAASGRTDDARGLLTVVIDRVRAAHNQEWIPILQEERAAYAAGQRWVESGRRHRELIGVSD